MRDLIVPLAVITPILVGFAGARILLWPDVVPLRMALEVGYRVVLLTAAMALLRERRGGAGRSRRGLLALSLLLLHLPWAPVAIAYRTRIFLAAEILLGLSMLAIVFDEAALRSRRLHVVQAITSASASAQQYGNLVQTRSRRTAAANREPKRCGSGLLEGGHLVATHAVWAFPRTSFATRALRKSTEELSKKMEHRQPWVSKIDMAGPENRGNAWRWKRFASW